MFGIGLSEIAVIALVAIIFIKPEDLPAFFRKAGKFYAKIKKAYDEVNQVKDQVMHEIDAAAKLEDDKPLEAKPATTSDMAPKPATEAAAGAEAAPLEPTASAVPDAEASPVPTATEPAPQLPAAQPEAVPVSHGLSAARVASPASPTPAEAPAGEPSNRQ